MKKLYAFICICLSVGVLSAQNIIDKHYEHYVEMDESTVISVSSLTFQYAANFVPENTEEEREMKEFIESVESFDLVKVSIDDPKAEYRNALALIGDDYDELINVKDGTTRASIRIDEEDGIVYELVGVVAEDRDFVIFSLLCEVELDKIGEMISKIDSDKFAPLKDAGIAEVSEMRAYPNPITASAELTVDIPSSMDGGQLSLIDANGSQVHKETISGTQTTISTAGYTPGYYIVNIENGGFSMKKKVLVVR